jgi:hypothetical protein
MSDKSVAAAVMTWLLGLLLAALASPQDDHYPYDKNEQQA